MKVVVLVKTSFYTCVGELLKNMNLPSEGIKKAQIENQVGKVAMWR